MPFQQTGRPTAAPLYQSEAAAPPPKPQSWRDRELAMYLSGATAGFGAGGSVPPSEAELADYQARRLAPTDYDASGNYGGGGVGSGAVASPGQSATPAGTGPSGPTPPPAPVAVGSNGAPLTPAPSGGGGGGYSGGGGGVPAAPDPNISPVTGMPRSQFSQDRRAAHDDFMAQMSAYQMGAGPFPTMGPRPQMPGQGPAVPGFGEPGWDPRSGMGGVPSPGPRGMPSVGGQPFPIGGGGGGPMPQRGGMNGMPPGMPSGYPLPPDVAQRAMPGYAPPPPPVPVGGAVPGRRPMPLPGQMPPQMPGTRRY